MSAPAILKMLSNYKLPLFLGAYVVLASLTLLFCDGTGDSGDSIMHYLFARYAPQHPEFYFDHWAKPVFVLLLSPFAQLGFIGAKIFNALVLFLSLWVSYKTIQKLKIKLPIVGLITLIFSPLVYILTFSGLTEPLFALFLITGIYLILNDKAWLAAIVISFLPFIRSEGLIFLGIFFFYFIIKKQWKIAPLLISGHLLYSFAGYFFYHDFLWVINKIPYSSLNSPYGNGTLSHFAQQLFYVLGAPIYFLLIFGILIIPLKLIKKAVSKEITILIYLGFLAFFIAHSLFWYLGIFNSMGLIRVFVAVSPLMAIIFLLGFNYLMDFIPKNRKALKSIFQTLILALILIFPFTHNPAAIDWKKDLCLTENQLQAQQLIDYVSEQNHQNYRYIYANPYLSTLLNINHFDTNIHLELTSTSLQKLNSHDVVIWDHIFAAIYNGITRESLDNNPNLQCIYSIKDDDQIIYRVYKPIINR